MQWGEEDSRHRRKGIHRMWSLYAIRLFESHAGTRAEAGAIEAVAEHGWDVKDQEPWVMERHVTYGLLALRTEE